ncbi:hypothetical protein [Frondihabitans cladoniiphilus]|uniref:Zinc finger Ogr/Delta-type domain-containing protein n=1 Tax=Frondihabitans cladoniiphilus TaxID=715785 RepID=A0ABP8WEC5_9MICO
MPATKCPQCGANADATFIPKESRGYTQPAYSYKCEAGHTGYMNLEPPTDNRLTYPGNR